MMWCISCIYIIEKMLVYSKQHVIISFTLYKISSFIIFCATLIPFTLLVFIYLSLFNSLFERYAYRYICMTQRVVDKSINNPLGQLSFLNNAYSTTPIRNYLNILFNSPWCHFLLSCWWVVFSCAQNPGVSLPVFIYGPPVWKPVDELRPPTVLKRRSDYILYTQSGKVAAHPSCLGNSLGKLDFLD